MDSKNNKDFSRKKTQLAAILRWEDRLKAAAYAIEMLEAQAEDMDKESTEYGECLDALFNSRQSLSKAFSLLVIRKAQLGIVGDKFYEDR